MLLFGEWASAVDQKEILDPYFASFSSPFLEVIKKDSPYLQEPFTSYPFFARFLQMDIFKYQPSVTMPTEEGQCAPRLFRLAINQSSGDFEDVKSIYRDWLRRCEGAWSSELSDPVSNGYLTMMLKFDVERHPYVRPVILHLPGGLLLKGLLGLKGDLRPRPLVIVRVGIFSGGVDFQPERFLLLQLFEQSPFNILILESTSSNQFIKRNRILAVGGFDEGIQDFQVAQGLLRKQEPLSRLIQSVHLVGFSLGGHGMLYASLLNEFNQDQGKVFASFMGLCPLVNFRDTVDFHLSQPVSHFVAKNWIPNRLMGSWEAIRELDPKDFLTSLLRYWDDTYRGAKNWQPSIRLPGLSSAQGVNFWRANDFWPSFRGVKTPIFIFATEKDPVVPYAVNSGRLYSGEQMAPGSQLAVFPLANGYHCTLPGAYRWLAMSELLQNFIRVHSRKFQLEDQDLVLPLPEDTIGFLKTYGFHPQISVEAPLGERHLKIAMRFQKSEFPSWWEIFRAPKKDFEVPLELLGYAQTQAITGEAEQGLFRRWFAQNAVFDWDGKSLKVHWQR